MTAAPTPVALIVEVAAQLTASGIPARVDVVEGDAYLKLDLTHDGMVVAWLEITDLSYAIVRSDGEPARLDVRGPLEAGWEPCQDPLCLVAGVFAWALAWRASQ